MKTTRIADGLGWPEGPALLPDGRVIFVATYRSQVSVAGPRPEAQAYAAAGGRPRSSA